MDYLYSLYDALVSINVPNDKARAVVDAMERDMGTTIATKTDLQLLRQEMATKADLAGIRQEQALLRNDLEAQSAGFGKDIDAMSASFRKDLETLTSSVHKDLQLLSTTMTVRLGSMLVAGFGATIAVLKLL
jgi:hypothetical protein